MDLDNNPLYNNGTPVCNGTFTTTDYKPTRGSWTVGANYEFTSNMSAYARYNTGIHFLDFDNGIRGSTFRGRRFNVLVRRDAGSVRLTRVAL